MSRLTRTNGKIAGVCGGLGEYFNIDPNILRIALVVITVFTAGIGGVIAYGVAAAVIPKDNQLPGYRDPDRLSGGGNAPPADVQFCRHCGYKNPAKGKFCASCGQPL